MTGLELTLLRPLWLLALPVLSLVGWWLLMRRGGIGDWDRVADPALLAAMTALGRVDRRSGRASSIAALVICLAGILALSGPAVERREALSYRNLDGVILAVDTSSSVTENELWPQLQTMGRFALSALRTRPGALIVFAGDAYVAMDLTLDHTQLGQTFSLIDAQTVPDPGSRPGRALTLAGRLLDEGGVLSGDVILLSDGAGLGPETLAAAEEIAARGARLSLVSMHAPSPEMQAHATLAGGRVFALTDIEAMTAFLKTDARTRLEQREYPLLFWHDMGRYLILIALLPMIFLFRRQST